MADGRKYYGVYRGEVVDVADPLELGRVKVRVQPLYDSSDIPLAAVPWAVPAFGLMQTAMPSYATWSIPTIDSMVYIMFEAGSPDQPIYFASAIDGVNGQPSFKDTNYPYRKGTAFNNGVIMYNDESDDTVIVQHPTGSYTKFFPDGSIKAYTVVDADIEALHDVTILAANDASVTALNDVAITATNNIDVLAGNQLAVTAQGITINVNGNCVAVVNGNLTVGATGTMQLTAPSVQINP